MITLASSSVSDMFTVPNSDWTVINQRVGEVLLTVNIQDYITSMLPAYPSLMSSSLLWKNNTFHGLISQSQALTSYANEAIVNFGNLNTQVKQIIQSGNTTIPDALQQQTLLLLQKLKNDTIPLANTSDELSQQVLSFLNNNITVDAQAVKFKAILGSFWAPIGDNINRLEASAGHVTGVWRAITDDLKNTLASPITVDMPFIESLNIDAAIISWQNVQAEASAFPSMTTGQENYWTKPF